MRKVFLINSTGAIKLKHQYINIIKNENKITYQSLRIHTLLNLKFHLPMFSDGAVVDAEPWTRCRDELYQVVVPHAYARINGSRRIVCAIGMLLHAPPYLPNLETMLLPSACETGI